MIIKNQNLNLNTKGFCDIHDITPAVERILREADLQNGLVSIFVPGSTGAITTIEYEPGLIQDLHEFFEQLIPQSQTYHHDATWGDGNGFSHLRASILGPGLSIPVENGRLTLGTWQQIIFVDFDNRPRHRTIKVNIIGN